MFGLVVVVTCQSKNRLRHVRFYARIPRRATLLGIRMIVAFPIITRLAGGNTKDALELGKFLRHFT